MPLISIIIPMRNAEAFIDETLRGLRAQKDVEIEIIVIDDGSTDRGPAIVKDHASRDPRVRIISGPQRGISAAFNAGLAEARGELLCRCDADDLYPHERLVQQLAWLDAHSDHIAVTGGYATVTAGGKLVDEFVVRDGTIDITDELLAGRGRSHVCAYLFRTEALRRLDGCREYFETSEDADLQFRLA
ncbi:MAG TPA: glycosyltransferase family 2 protein, partial [Tepidisphaeraceae bacterium]|nr:glycosyltransferase family 2 protein [Tepidisphaeraceae bacterium]